MVREKESEIDKLLLKINTGESKPHVEVVHHHHKPSIPSPRLPNMNLKKELEFLKSKYEAEMNALRRDNEFKTEVNTIKITTLTPLLLFEVNF